MKKLLLTLLGAAAVFSTARAGTVYERTTLENVVQTGEQFALFACGTIPRTTADVPTLIWAAGFNTTAASNGLRGFTSVPGINVTPERFNRSLFIDETGYNYLPAKFSLESAGDNTYYLQCTQQYTPTATPTSYYVGSSSSGGAYSATTTKTETNVYRWTINPATCTWLTTGGSKVTADNAYRMASVAQSAVNMCMLVQANKTGVLLGFIPSAKLTDGNIDFTDYTETDLAAQKLKRFPSMYRVIETEEQIFGTSGQSTYALQLGLSRSMPAPALTLKTVKEGGVALATPEVITSPVTYKYEVEEGADVLSIAADGTFTGIGEGTARVRVSLSDESARYYDVAEPFYMTVTVGNFININLVKTAPADFGSKSIVLVSNTPVNGVGFAAANTTNPGTGTMRHSTILPGQTTLPNEVTLSVDSLNGLRQFTLLNSGTNYCFKMLNSGGVNKWLHIEKTAAITYRTTSPYVFALNAIDGGGYSPSEGSYRLGFWNAASGITTGAGNTPSTDETRRYYPGNLTSGSYPNQVTGIEFYSIVKSDASISLNSALSLNPGETASVGAQLKAIASNGELAAASGATLNYQVVDANDAVIAADVAPFSVAADGTITAIKGGEARVKVTLTGDYTRYFNVEPVYCDVIVRTPVLMFLTDNTEGNADDMELEMYAGQTITLSSPIIKTSTDSPAIEGATFTYMLADDNYEPMYDASGAPVTSNDFLSVDPATGVVTAKKGVDGIVNLIAELSEETSKRYCFKIGDDVLHPIYIITILPPVEATVVVGDSEEDTTLNADSGSSLTLPAPSLKVDGAEVDDVTFKFVLVDAEGNPLTDAEGNPLTENELVSVNPQTGEVTFKEGATGTVRVAPVLDGESALKYAAERNYIYTLNVSEPVMETYVRLTTRAELDVLGMEGLLVLASRDFGGDLGYVGASATPNGTSPNITYSPVSLGLTELSTELSLREKTVADLLKFNVYYAYGVDSKVNQTDGYRVMLASDGRFVYHTGNAIALTDRAGIDGANGGGGFWYNISTTADGAFQVKTGGNYLGFNESGVLTRIGSGVLNGAGSRIAFYAPYQAAEVLVDGAAAGEISLYPGQTATIPVPSVKTTGEEGKTFTGVPFAFTVLNPETGEPYAGGEAPVAVDSEGNITVLRPGQAKVVVTVAEPFDKFFDIPEGFTYDVNVDEPAPAVIAGPSGESGFTLDLAPEKTATLPKIELTAGSGSDAEKVENVTYKYEIIDPATGEPFAEGEAPISVDPATGEITTLRPGEARVKISLDGESALTYSAEPLFVDVNVKNVNFITLVKVDDPSALSADQTVVFVSSRTLPGLGFAAASNSIVGSSGNMPAKPVMPGLTSLPAEFTVTVEQADSLKLFHVYTPSVSAGGYGFQMINTNKTGTNYTNWYLKSQTLSKILYSQTAVTDYELNVSPAGGYAPTRNNMFLAFFKTINGAVTSVRGSFDSPNVANIEFYSLVKTQAQLAGNTETPLIVEPGDTLTVPVTTLTPEGGFPIEGVSYTYEVVDEKGNPFPEGEAPISVDENGNVTVNEGVHGTARIKVTVSGNESLYYDADPVYFDVTVPATVHLEFENGTTSDGITIPEGAEGNTVPTPSLTLDNGDPVEGVAYKYEVINPETGEPFAEGEAPISVDENGNITTLRPGAASVKVSLSDEDAIRYKTEPIVYEVKVTSPTEITGLSGEETYTVDLGVGTSTPLPEIKVTTVKEGEVVPVEGVSYKYEVIDPETGEPFAEGTAPVTVDPVTGEVTATDIEGAARIKVTLSDKDAEDYDADPFFVDVNVKNFVYITMEQVADLSTLTPTDNVVFVSSRTIAGKGFVASASATVVNGINTGSTGNMAPISILPGVTALPEIIKLPVERADSLRKFNVLAPAEGDAGYGFLITDRNLYVKSEKNDRIRYFGTPFMNYTIGADAAARTVVSGNYNLGFNSTGLLTNGNNQTINVNGANIAFYLVHKTKAELNAAETELTLQLGTTTGLELPELTATGSNGKPVTISPVSYKYEVINPETGEPFAEGEAPIVVDENGNITVVGSGKAQVKVSVTGETDGNFDVAPIVIDVNVPDVVEAQIVFENGTIDETVSIAEGTTGTSVTTPTLVDTEGNEITGVRFKYEVIDPETGEPFAEGEAPISVDPETGEITTLKTGKAVVKVTLADEDAAAFEAEPAFATVNVTNPVAIKGINDEETIEMPLGLGKQTTVPELKLTVTEGGEEREIEGVGYKYEVIDPATGEPFAEGKAPIEVDENGNVTTTGVEGSARIKVIPTGETAEGYDVDPFYVDVPVKNYVYITYTQVTSVAELDNLIAAGEGVIVVSTRAFDGKGFVAASSTRDAANNFTPLSILPGETSLPVEMTLTDEEAAKLLNVNIEKQGTTYGLKLSTGQYLKRKVNNQVILQNAFSGYALSEVPSRAAGAGYRVASGGNFLGFVANGNLSHQNSNNVFNNGAAPAFFAIKKAESNLTLDGEKQTEVVLEKGESSIVPTPELTATGSDGSTVKVTDPSVKYEVIDPATGEPFAEGEAPIEVDENGNITAVKGGEARIKVTPTGETEMLYDADPSYVDVIVPTKATLEPADDIDSIVIDKQTVDPTVPTPVLTVDGRTKEGVTYKYEVVDPETGEPFAEGEAPIEVDENGNITVLKSGHAKVVVTLSDEDAKRYNADPVTYDVTVKAVSTAIGEISADADAVYYNQQGVRVKNPSAGIYIRVSGGRASKVLVK